MNNESSLHTQLVILISYLYILHSIYLYIYVFIYSFQSHTPSKSVYQFFAFSNGFFLSFLSLVFFSPLSLLLLLLFQFLFSLWILPSDKHTHFPYGLMLVGEPIASVDMMESCCAMNIIRSAFKVFFFLRILLEEKQAKGCKQKPCKKSS